MSKNKARAKKRQTQRAAGSAPKPAKPPPTIIYPSAPSVIPPRLYSPVETLCRDAILYSGNHAGMRASIRALAFAMRGAAEDSVGHVTADTLALEGLLKRSDARQAELPFREAQKDPVEELHRQAHLNAQQVSAADLIRRVWTAWGRHLVVAGKAFDGTPSPRRLVDPVMSMGASLLNEWHGVYTPWYEQAKKKFERREAGGMVPVTRLVISVVMEPVFPGALDKLERLKLGTSLRVLKTELTELAKAQERGTYQND